MSALAISTSVPPALSPPSPAMLTRLAQAQECILACPPVEIVTEHILHGGMYARTIRLAPDTLMMGSLIRLATLLIVSGNCVFTNGDECVELNGYNVLAGNPGRKQLFLAKSLVEMTMIFPTEAQSVTEAEDEVFAEADQLVSRKDGSHDQVMITGQGRS